MQFFTGKGLVLLLVFCVLSPMSGFAKKFIPEYNRKKPITVVSGDTAVIFYIRKDGISNVREKRQYHYYFHGQVFQNQGAYLGHLLEGEFVRLDGNGRLLEKGTFKDGLKQGEWKRWYANGELKGEQLWRNGKPAKTRFEYTVDGDKIKYCLKKNEWVRRPKLKEPKELKPPAKRKLLFFKRKPDTDSGTDSLLVKSSEVLEQVQTPIVSENNRKTDPQAKAEAQSPAEYLREHMSEYEQAQKDEKAVGKKNKKVKSGSDRKAKKAEQKAKKKEQKEKTTTKEEKDERDPFFKRIWSKLTKHNSAENEEKKN